MCASPRRRRNRYDFDLDWSSTRPPSGVLPQQWGFITGDGRHPAMQLVVTVASDCRLSIYGLVIIVCFYVYISVHISGFFFESVISTTHASISAQCECVLLHSWYILMEFLFSCLLFPRVFRVLCLLACSVNDFFSIKLCVLYLNQYL